MVVSSPHLASQRLTLQRARDPHGETQLACYDIR